MIYAILLGLFFTFVIVSAIKTIVEEEAKKTKRIYNNDKENK